VLILHTTVPLYFKNYVLIYLLTYLLKPWSTVFLEKLTGLRLVKKFPAFLYNPQVLYHTHKCPPPVPILSQLHSVLTKPSNFLKIHLISIIPSTSGSPQWPLSLRFPHQHPCALLSPPYTPHARLISFFSILPPAQYWVRNTDHSAPHYGAELFNP
jgi:hypothetical protein